MKASTKAIVKVSTEMGSYTLRDICGLKEGMIVEGRLHANGKAFEFKWRGLDAVLWIGDNARLYRGKKAACNVAESK